MRAAEQFVRLFLIMSLRISDELAAKANSFPESSYGATTATLVLDGKRIDEVVPAGASDIVIGHSKGRWSGCV
jgi:hypothetical protein